jgi:hypothetical protein
VSEDSPTADGTSDAATARVPADLGASASLSFDTVDATDAAVSVDVVGDDDPVGVELALDLGAVRSEVVVDADATADLIADLRDGLAALDE